MKKICVITSSRADYGLLRHLIREIEASKDLVLKLVASGSHLSKSEGLTIKEIEADGFEICAKIEIFKKLYNNNNEISTRISNAVIKFTDLYEKLKPDFVLLLGDRYEVFSAAISATISRIPIIHLHGGELTEGAYDESFRHSISKMSHIHFAAAPEYRNRLIQLGENPNNVFCFGGLGVDAINRTKILSKYQLAKALNIELGSPCFLITYHPITLEQNYGIDGLDQIFEALKFFPEAKVCFTSPNADTNSIILTNKIKNFVKNNYNAYLFSSMGQIKYYSCLKYFDAVIGNSSSGLLEAPSFQIPTINIGNRQNGRLKADSVIDCELNSESITKAIKLALSPTFLEKIKMVKNPYGDGGAAQKIRSVIENIDTTNIIPKKFYDIKDISFP